MADAEVNESRLYGSWDLQRWRRIAADGSVTLPHTDNGRGRIVYERSGRMAAFLVHPDWPAPGLVNGFTAYSGPFKVEDGSVHHMVDFASQPSMVGKDLVRKVTLRGELLILEAAAIDEAAARHELEWRRVTA
ncbi:lipocalin-like domain-containing protein [Phenylobacterium sp.]|jgi:hypothetical protein|uniref:lipocalin-like domain-containing protein n=1 Tax=Phenylobacterium sp. TaxID=1871053 RepID=UPI002F412D3B